MAMFSLSGSILGECWGGGIWAIEEDGDRGSWRGGVQEMEKGVEERV